jgi:hypothetical protein
MDSNILKSTVLYCRHGGNHDKVYQIQIKRVPGGFLCESQYGRRGNALKEARPMKQPGTLRQAEEVFWKLYGDKSDEYTEDAFGNRLAGRAPIFDGEARTKAAPLRAAVIMIFKFDAPVNSLFTCRIFSDGSSTCDCRRGEETQCNHLQLIKAGKAFDVSRSFTFNEIDPIQDTWVKALLREAQRYSVKVEAGYAKNQRKTPMPVKPKQAAPQPINNPTPALFAPARRKLFLEDDE